VNDYTSLLQDMWAVTTVELTFGGGAAAVPPPFRPCRPALCGSRPLVTPYYCRLGDLLCYTCTLYLSTILCVYVCVICVFFVFGVFPLQLSPSVLWYCWLGLLTCKNRLPYNLYCVGGDVKHCPIQSNQIQSNRTNIQVILLACQLKIIRVVLQPQHNN